MRLATTSPTLSAVMFNGERLKQAREIAGLTQQDLADAVGQKIDRSYISYIEQGARQPSPEVVQWAALATGFPKSFFARASGPDFPLGSILFRKRSSLASTELARVRQTSRLVLELFLGLQQRFKPVAVTIPRIGDVEAPAAAQLMRSALGYPPEGPVRGLMTRMEAAGILVFRLPFQIQDFDAFSAWSLEREMRPVIALGVGRAGERDRATLAHELGHLALHSSFLGELSTVEGQSIEFAGEFLLPAADMREEFSADLPITLTRLAELKGKWGVSMQFLLLRVEQLRIISPQLKSYWRGKLHKQGWLEEEPVSLRPDTPKLLREMLERSFGAPVDAGRLTSEFGLPARFVKELLAANGREPWRPEWPPPAPPGKPGPALPGKAAEGSHRLPAPLKFPRGRA